MWPHCLTLSVKLPRVGENPGQAPWLPWPVGCLHAQFYQLVCLAHRSRYHRTLFATDKKRRVSVTNSRHLTNSQSVYYSLSVSYAVIFPSLVNVHWKGSEILQINVDNNNYNNIRMNTSGILISKQYKTNRRSTNSSQRTPSAPPRHTLSTNPRRGAHRRGDLAHDLRLRHDSLQLDLELRQGRPDSRSFCRHCGTSPN